MVDANYPAVANTPALTYGSRVNSYSGFDRFGRVVNQKWQNQTGGVVKDQFKYAYDYTSNRTSRQVSPDAGTPPNGQDDYYQYDNLDRLMKRNRGTLSGGAVTDANANLNQAWAELVDSVWQTRLDPVGNWTKFLWDSNGGGNGWTTQSRAHNKANEIAGNGGNPISGTGAANWVDPTYDLAGNMTAGPKPGDEAATTSNYTYDAWNRLVKVADGETTVAEYRYDGRHRRRRRLVDPADNREVRRCMPASSRGS
jgi:YD repeat-containing protein